MSIKDMFRSFTSAVFLLKETSDKAIQARVTNSGSKTISIVASSG